MLKVSRGILVSLFLFLCSAVPSVKLFSENVVVSGLELRRDGKSIEIGGHTDDVGSAQKNLVLSKRRAILVMAYLVQKGLDPKTMTAVGYGGSKPVKRITSDLSRETKDEYRALNRRVEFFIKK